MARRRALSLLALVVACLAAVPAGASAIATHSLLPLGRGHLQVLLGDLSEWRPVSGQPLSLTVFSGRPRAHDAAALNAYVALRSTARSCTASAAAAHARPLHPLGHLYSRSHLVNRGSVFAPNGGTRGVYAVSQPRVLVRTSRMVRVCVWLARTPRQRGLALTQDVPLLNGLFAASVSALPSAAAGAGQAYTLDAVDVARSFRFTVTSTRCGTAAGDGTTTVGDGTLGTETVSFSGACPSDGSLFSFSTPFGRSLGSISYGVAQALAAPPQVAALGGCELNPLAVVPLGTALQYVAAVGCTVRRVLVAPFQRGLPRGAVLEAQIDGGTAEAAPRGTAVDLVVNGRR